MPITKDSYRKNSFLVQNAPQAPVRTVIDIQGPRINTVVDKLNDISSSIANGLSVNGTINGTGGSPISYSTQATVITGSVNIGDANLLSDTARTSVVFLNNTDVEIAVKLSSSIAPSYIIGAAQTYEAIQANAQLAHNFEYYDTPATKGKWYRTFTK
jgi:hypothetical protein